MIGLDLFVYMELGCRSLDTSISFLLLLFATIVNGTLLLYYYTIIDCTKFNFFYSRKDDRF